MPKPHAVSWEEKHLAALVDAAEDAIKRGRYVLLTISVTGILILTSQFNGMLSWLRHARLRAPPENPIRGILDEVVFRDLQVVSVPVLGIKLSAYDLSVVGGLALFILAVWLYFSLRRECHAVIAIADLADAAVAHDDLPRARYLYHGVVHHFVLATITEQDTITGHKGTLPRCSVWVMFNMPVWIPLVVVLADLLSLFVPQKNALNMNQALWNQLSTNEAWEAGLRMCIALGFAVGSFIVCRDADAFENAALTRLRQLRAAIEAD